MSNTFFVVLPSNTKSYETNKPCKFRVRLPNKIVLDGNYTVALQSIIYPNTWNAIGTTESQFLQINLNDGQSFKYQIPKGSYLTAEQLAENLHLGIIRELAKDIERKVKYPVSIEPPTKKVKRSIVDLSKEIIEDNEEVDETIQGIIPITGETIAPNEPIDESKQAKQKDGGSSGNNATKPSDSGSKVHTTETSDNTHARRGETNATGSTTGTNKVSGTQKEVSGGASITPSTQPASKKEKEPMPSLPSTTPIGSSKGVETEETKERAKGTTANGGKTNGEKMPDSTTSTDSAIETSVLPNATTTGNAKDNLLPDDIDNFNSNTNVIDKQPRGWKLFESRPDLLQRWENTEFKDWSALRELVDEIWQDKDVKPYLPLIADTLYKKDSDDHKYLMQYINDDTRFFFELQNLEGKLHAHFEEEYALKLALARAIKFEYLPDISRFMLKINDQRIKNVELSPQICYVLGNLLYAIT